MTVKANGNRPDPRPEQLRAALTAACEPLAILRPVPDPSNQSIQAEALRMDIIHELHVRCRRARIGVELVEVGTQERSHGRVLGHRFAQAPDPQAGDVLDRTLFRRRPADPGVPVDGPRPLVLVNATRLDLLDLEDLRDLTLRCFDEVTRRARPEAFEVPGQDIRIAIAEAFGPEDQKDGAA